MILFKIKCLPNLHPDCKSLIEKYLLHKQTEDTEFTEKRPDSSNLSMISIRDRCLGKKPNISICILDLQGNFCKCKY